MNKVANGLNLIVNLWIGQVLVKFMRKLTILNVCLYLPSLSFFTFLFHNLQDNVSSLSNLILNIQYSLCVTYSLWMVITFTKKGRRTLLTTQFVWTVFSVITKEEFHNAHLIFTIISIWEHTQKRLCEKVFQIETKNKKKRVHHPYIEYIFPLIKIFASTLKCIEIEIPIQVL